MGSYLVRVNLVLRLTVARVSVLFAVPVVVMSGLMAGDGPIGG